MKRLILFLVIALSFALAPLFTTTAQTVITSGGIVIDKPGFYQLGRNVLCQDFGIIVRADSVVLDGAGYTLQGDGSGWANGITIQAHHVTVTGLYIRNFVGRGISLEWARDCQITNNVISDNSGEGIFLSNSERDTVSHCIVSNNEGVGVIAFRSIESVITQNKFKGHTYAGVLLNFGLGPQHNQITFNEFDERYQGIILGLGCDENEISGNSGSAGTYGIYLASSNNHGNGNTITAPQGNCINCDGDGNDVRWGTTAVNGQADTPPEDFRLEQNYPNPFNPETVIKYQLPVAGHVRLSIYTLLGQEVRRLVDRSQVAAYHVVVWDGRDDTGNTLPSGIYFYRLESGNFQVMKKMILMK